MPTNRSRSLDPNCENRVLEAPELRKLGSVP